MMLRNWQGWIDNSNWVYCVAESIIQNFQVVPQDKDFAVVGFVELKDQYWYWGDFSCAFDNLFTQKYSCSDQIFPDLVELHQLVDEDYYSSLTLTLCVIDSDLCCSYVKVE
jgi:hypothetical protein